MNTHKQVVNVVSAFVAAEQARTRNEGLPQIAKYEKAQKKLAKAHKNLA